MEAKEIIIKLIDEDKITGEEASVLFEAINSKISYVPYYVPYYDNKPWYSDDTIITATNKDSEGNVNSITFTD